METIRILIYTDKSDISSNCHFWGLKSMEQFVALKLKGLADVKFTMRNRHFDYLTNQPDVNGATPLNATLLRDFDEIWIFGARQANTKSEPHNELDPKEIDALRNWMKEGGVLITGDHSDPINSLECNSDHKDFVNLGAAIGRCIPRAGDLRVWDGPPTGCYEGLPLELRDNHNTQEGDHRNDLDRMNLQTDAVPQTLRLTPGIPHRIFWWAVDQDSGNIIPITLFPDHIHEGDLKIPKMAGEWPAKSAPPIVIAWGRDKRFPKEERYYRIVSAYDGDSGCVGRIVADSSFHHYIDRNLLAIPARKINRDPEPGSPLDQIAQYYGNLALWLAPEKLREKMAWGLFYSSASHPDVLEEKASAPKVLGKTAMALLVSETSISNLYRLLAPSELEHGENLISEPFSQVFLPADSNLESERELVLGHVIKEYHRHFAQIGLSDPGCRPRNLPHTQIVLRGLENAINDSKAPPEILISFRKAAKHYDSQLNN